VSGRVERLFRMHPRNIRHHLPTERVRQVAGRPPQVVARTSESIEADVRAEDAALYDDDELRAMLRVGAGRVERGEEIDGWIRVRIRR
jgi:hypothetical protein